MHGPYTHASKVQCARSALITLYTVSVQLQLSKNNPISNRTAVLLTLESCTMSCDDSILQLNKAPAGSGAEPQPGPGQEAPARVRGGAPKTILHVRRLGRFLLKLDDLVHRTCFRGRRDLARSAWAR